jgi:hypothetical protein
LVTAWVLYALADYDQPATPEEISLLLQRQGETGWWSMFPSTPDEVNASTAATAWTLLALHHQYERKLIGPEQRPAVSEAMRKTLAWLTGRALPGQARWTEYPPGVTSERGIEYLAPSALALHVLHIVGKTNTFDAPWLEQLPQRVPGAIENEISKGYVHLTKTDLTLDDARHYTFPWMLRATVESYANATASERVRALLWLEEAFQNPRRVEDFGPEYWTMAETLFALREVQQQLAPATP